MIAPRFGHTMPAEVGAAVPLCPGCGLRHASDRCPVELVAAPALADREAIIHYALEPRNGDATTDDPALVTCPTCLTLERWLCPSCGGPVAPDSACGVCRAEAGL